MKDDADKGHAGRRVCWGLNLNGDLADVMAFVPGRAFSVVGMPLSILSGRPGWPSTL